jgi:hypothetical protein
VWKAYGKFNLSAPSRNQNIAELRNYFSRIGAACFSATVRVRSVCRLAQCVRAGCTDFADAISRLVSYTEKRYNHKVTLKPASTAAVYRVANRCSVLQQVTAVQINMHFTSASHHKQHRDIYSLDQADRAGR